MSQNLTEEEAAKELAEINAEIAKKKGLDPETGEPIKKDGDDEPDEKKKEEEVEPKDEGKDEDDKSDEDKDADDDADETDEDDEGEVTPTPVRKPKTLLAKLQETKRVAREEAEAKDKKIAELQAIVDESKNLKAADTEIKDYAEKYGMSEEQVRDQFKILEKFIPKQKTEANPILDKAAILIQKQEAKEAFEKEFSELLTDFPETRDLREKIQKEAYKPENLQKTLYEVYQRYVKPSVTIKKKTGESTRTGGRDGGDAGTPDFAKIAENLKNSVPNALKGLSGEQQDKLFDWMEKQGSRYK